MVQAVGTPHAQVTTIAQPLISMILQYVHVLSFVLLPTLYILFLSFSLSSFFVYSFMFIYSLLIVLFIQVCVGNTCQSTPNYATNVCTTPSQCGTNSSCFCINSISPGYVGTEGRGGDRERRK